jgi:capsular exopolysaccharide synthesis family protein
VAVAVFLVVVVYSRSLQPIYRTSASIEVTKAIATEGMERWLYYKGHPIETAMRQIKSATCLEAALRSLGELTEASSEEDIRNKVGLLAGMISVSAEPNTNILSVAATGSDKEVLEKYVNAVCRVYAQLEQEWARSADDEVIEFLEERIAQYRARLEKAEAAMIAFKGQNVARGIGADISSQLKLRNDLAMEIARTVEELEEIRSRRGSWGLEQSPYLTELFRRRDDLRMKRDEMLERFTENHPAVTKYQEELRRIETVIDEQRLSYESRNRARFEAALEERTARVAALRQQLRDVEEGISSLPSDQIVLSNLEMELGLAKGLYKMFWERIEQQKIVRQSKSGGVVFQGPAAAPRKIYPNEKAHQTVGLAMGVLLGIAFAFLLETMDTSIRTIEEIEEFVGVPVLGVVPLIVSEPVDPKETRAGPGAPKSESPGSIVHFHPRDPASESYRALASALEFTFFNEGHRVLLVASATPQEGKTTSVSNIGTALAASGRKTILLDGNLRHPGVTRIFNLSGHAGLAEVLGGFVPWRICAYPTILENLEVMPTGALPGQPAELIKNGLPALLRELSTVYAAILIDSPPILPVADASIISSMAGGTLLVYSQGKAPRDVLIRAKNKIETAKGRVIGTFLNKVQLEGELGRNYYYYYYSYYPQRGGKGGRGRDRHVEENGNTLVSL